MGRGLGWNRGTAAESYWCGTATLPETMVTLHHWGADWQLEGYAQGEQGEAIASPTWKGGFAVR